LGLVSGLKWVLLLEPTEHNFKMWGMGTYVPSLALYTWDDQRPFPFLAEKAEVPADTIWFPDLCANSAVKKIVLRENQALRVNMIASCN
jgi:hypothetical protein